MTDDDRNEIDAVLAKNLDSVYEEFRELSARLSAQRFLLEDLYADKYIRELPAFQTRMDVLLALTRSSPVKGNPMEDDALQDLQVRIATHLQRFQNAVEPRIVSRSA